MRYRENSSFARRLGRGLRSGQKDLLATLDQVNEETGVCFNQDGKLKIPDGRYTKIVLEVGFGSGVFLHEMSLKHPDYLFIGCEPYINGVISLLSKITKEGNKNIFIWKDDAKKILTNIENGTIDSVYILFPDPWPKKKHHKRRLVSSEFLEMLYHKMSANADLRIATDHAEYAKWILYMLIVSKYFVNQAKLASDWCIDFLELAKTKYQLKAENQNKKSFYFHFRRLDVN